MNFNMILSKEVISSLAIKRGLQKGDKIPYSFKFSTHKYGPLKFSGYLLAKQDFDHEYTNVRVHVYSLVYNVFSYLTLFILLLLLGLFVNVLMAVCIGIGLTFLLFFLYLEIETAAKNGIRKMLNSK